MSCNCQQNRPDLHNSSVYRFEQHQSGGGGQWKRYTLRAISTCLRRLGLTLESGLQCHTAPYSWKLVFISDHQLYEVILTACTPKEEIEWRTRLSTHQASENQEQAQPAIFSLLSLNIKTLGTVFRKPGTYDNGRSKLQEVRCL